MAEKKIIVGCDHAGFELKSRLMAYLKEQGYDVVDVGCYTRESTDYPQVAYKLAQQMKEDGIEKGILCCGSGVGVSIAANRFPHIRAVLAQDETVAKLSRQHNNSNVLCMGERVTLPEIALKILKAWLSTEFEGGRHENRVNQLSDPQIERLTQC